MIWLGAIAVVAAVLMALLVVGVLHNLTTAIRELALQVKRSNDQHTETVHIAVAFKLGFATHGAILQQLVDTLKNVRLAMLEPRARPH